jgi:hypothetical protein
MDFWSILLSFVIVSFMMSVLGKFIQWRIRASALAAIPPESLRRSAFGVHSRAFVAGVSSFKGISSKYLNRLKLDLALSETRFLVVSSRGALIDVGVGRGRKFQSVRCTGPQRLVIEGELSGVTQPGSYRFEMVIDDAEAWAKELAIWVDPNPDDLSFGEIPATLLKT